MELACSIPVAFAPDMSFQPPPYHQPPQTFTPAPKLTLRPRAAWYGLVAVPTVLIPLIGVVLLITGVAGQVKAIEPVGSGGQARIELDKGDKRGVYRDDSSAQGGGTCKVTGPDNETVSIDSQFGSYTVTEGSREWDAVGGFTARSAGKYTLACREGALAAFGPDPDIGGLFGKVLGIIGLFCAGPTLGFVVFLVILAMRASDKKRQRRELGLIVEEVTDHGSGTLTRRRGR